MNPKLTEILKKAKAVDQRANQMGTKIPSGGQTMTPTLTESMGVQPTTMPQMELPTSKPQPTVDVNSEAYKQRVKESKEKAIDENIEKANKHGNRLMQSIDEEGNLVNADIGVIMMLSKLV